MKTWKTLVAILLALSLTVGLGACSLFPEPEPKLPVEARTPLPKDDEARLAYYNLLLAGIAAEAVKVTVETSYGMDDIEVGNDTLKAAAPALKNSITAWLAGKAEFKLPDEAFFLPPALTAAEILAAGEEDPNAGGLQLQVRDLLEDIEIKNRLENLQKEIDEGKNTNMVNEGPEARREHVITQMGVSAKDEAEKYYQIDITLDPAAAERLLQPGDKEAVLAELSKSADYLLVEDYTLAPKELILFARVNKETDRFTELRITMKADLETIAKGAGPLEGEGEAPVTLTLTKTVKYTGFTWPETPEED